MSDELLSSQTQEPDTASCVTEQHDLRQNYGTDSFTGTGSITSRDHEKASSSKQPEWPGFLEGRWSQRSIIAVALSACAVALILGPSGYCWLREGRAQLADNYRGGAHPTEELDGSSCHKCRLKESPDGHHRPALYLGRDYVNEVASGGINGLLMMVATVLGGIGADVPGRHIFAMATASLAAYSFSMGFGAFVVESTKEEFSVSQLEEEYSEVRSMPRAEIDEMICHYRKRGLAEKDAESVAEILSKYEDFWVSHMMAEELGIQLPRGREHPVKAGLATGASFFFFGMVPLLGLTASIVLKRTMGSEWYRPQFSTMVSLVLSAISLLTLGSFVSRVGGSRTPLIDGLMMLANGCVACLMAVSISQLISSSSDRISYEEESCRKDTAANYSVSGRAKAPTGGSRDGGQLETESSSGGTWPSFRRQFVNAICVLWVGVTSIIVGRLVVVKVFYVESIAMDCLRVFGYGWLTCVTTGLGALPFLFVGPGAVGEGPLALANAVAAGMMLAASGGMLLEAHEHCGRGDWQILVGLAVGALFIRGSEHLHDSEEEDEGVAALHSAIMQRKHWRKAMLIFTVMFCHSAAEGIAVGVAFSRQLRSQFGVYISLLLAVHNVPEGLAVALVLVPRGVSATLATFIAMLTSVPQPLLALAAFLFVEVFQSLLPIGLAFAAGAMVYVCLHELLAESVEQLGMTKAALASAVSFGVMSICIYLLQSLVDV